MTPKTISAFLIIILAFAASLTGTSCRKKSDTDTPADTDESVLTSVAAVEDEQDGVNTTIGKLEWMADFEAAKKKAVAESKDLFLNFTGSDWCPWCEKLDKEVFSKRAFAEYAEQNFILVELDFPNDKSKLSSEIQQQNERLGAEYGVQGFPTIILTDKDGIPYAQTGYVEGGSENYVQHLKQFQSVRKQIDELIAKSEDAEIEGTERAAFLDMALQKLPPWVVDKYYVGKMKRIAELDADNKAGLKDKYLIRTRFIVVQQALERKDYDTALQEVTAIIDEFKPSGEIAQQLYFSQAHAKHFLKDVEGEQQSLEKALESAPEGFLAEQIKANLQQF
jgi:thioredoxin-related protein